MSSRNVRKLYGGSGLPPPDEDSDGDYQPFGRPTQSSYQGLDMSEDEGEEQASAAAGDEEGACAGPSSSSSEAAGRRSQKKKSKKVQRRAFGAPPGDELDEIDRSIRDVNALLGAPSPEPQVAKPKVSQGSIILGLQAKHLNVSNELRRLFGPDEPQNRRGRQVAQRIRMHRRIIVSPMSDTQLYEFRKSGLRMSIYRKDKSHTYFTFDHDSEYQRMHRYFLQSYSQENREQILLRTEEIRNQMYVEALLEVSDLMFRMGEASLGNETVENVMTYLQQVAHPSFNLTSNETRLEYKVLENRPFHVAMLKYMYLLSNKACHRTALEIAKMLLSLDPSDPLAILFVIDSIALRAREHQWLVDACQFFTKHREAGTLFNIQYSSSLALYHVATKAKTDTLEADKKLQAAMMSYPQVVSKILEFASISQPMITEHPLFRSNAQESVYPALDGLIFIYAKMTSARWREPGVMDWFVGNAKQVCDNFTNDESMRANTEDLKLFCSSLFRVTPPQVQRHFSVVRHMSNLLFDAPLTSGNRPTSSWDPLYERGVNRYDYPSPLDAPRAPAPDVDVSVLYRFIRSIWPTVND